MKGGVRCRRERTGSEGERLPGDDGAVRMSFSAGKAVAVMV